MATFLRSAKGLSAEELKRLAKEVKKFGRKTTKRKGRLYKEKRPFWKLAPREGLEPPTKWLQVPLTFLPGLDYLITRLHIAKKGVGRCRGLLVGVLNL